MPARDAPLNVQVPWSGRSKPVIRLKKVVLPAPFGPMSAVIEPRWTSTWPTSTAVRPPKRRRTLSVTRIGSGLAAPGSWGTSLRAWTASSRRTLADPMSGRTGISPGSALVTGMSENSAGIECYLLTVAEDPLRPVDQEQKQSDTHQHEPDGADVVAVHQPVRDGPRPDAARQDACGELKQAPEDHRADDRPQYPGGTAQDEHGVGEERDVRREQVGLHGGLGQREHEPAQRTEQTADDQRLHLVGVDVLAQAPNGVLVFADRLDHPAPRAAHERPDHQAGDYHQGPADGQHPGVAGVELERWDSDPVAIGVQIVEVVAEARQAAGASEGLPEGHGTEDQPDDLGSRDRDDGEIVGTQPQRRYAEQQGEDDDACEAHQHAEPERQAERGDDGGHAIGGDSHESGLAEVQQSGIAEVHVEADRGQCVHDRL